VCQHLFVRCCNGIFTSGDCCAAAPQTPLRFDGDPINRSICAGAFDLLTNGRIENIIQFLKILIEPSYFMDKKERH
jgi:hypothetical protein